MTRRCVLPRLHPLLSVHLEARPRHRSPHKAQPQKLADGCSSWMQMMKIGRCDRPHAAFARTLRGWTPLQTASLNPAPARRCPASTGMHYLFSL